MSDKWPPVWSATGTCYACKTPETLGRTLREGQHVCVNCDCRKQAAFKAKLQKAISLLKGWIKDLDEEEAQKKAAS